MNLGVWKGLLHWSMQYSDGTHNASDVKPLSEEDKKFLEKVFDSLVVDEVKRIKLIISILRWPEEQDAFFQQVEAKKIDLLSLERLNDSGTKDDEKKDEEREKRREEIEKSYLDLGKDKLFELAMQAKERALDELDDRVQQIDSANDVRMVGGLDCLIAQLQSQRKGIVWRAAQALSTVLQNNEKSQNWAVNDYHIVPFFMPLLALPPKLAAPLQPIALPQSSSSTGLILRPEQPASPSTSSSSSSSSAPLAESSYVPPEPFSDGSEVDAEDQKIVNKLISAIGSLIREQGEGRRQFIAAHGVERLVHLLGHPKADLVVKRKALILLRQLFQREQEAIDRAIQTGTVPLLIALIGKEDVDIRQFAPLTILDCVRRNFKLLAQLKAPESGLQKIVEQRLATINSMNAEDKASAKEEVEALTSIAKVCGFPRSK